MGVATTGASTGGFGVWLTVGFDDGGWFSASDDCGDCDGEIVACLAFADGVVPDRGVAGGRGRRLADCGGGGGRDLSVLAGALEAVLLTVGGVVEIGSADSEGTGTGAGTGFLVTFAGVGVILTDA